MRMITKFHSIKGLLLIVVCTFLFPRLSAQKVYFVDGYHGGIYGHYPVEWKTRFITENFHRHPEWRLSMEIEPETWDSVKKYTPDDYRAFEEIVTDDRMEFTNPSYAQPYCYNISGESIIRQFAYGIKKLHSHFPGLNFTTYSAEEPCFTSSLPQILKSFGFNYAVLKCPNTLWGGYVRAHGDELINWVGPDGTSMLTVPRYTVEALEENSTWQTTAWANSEEYLKACFDAGIKHPVGMCFQDAGWKNGPWLGNGDNIKNKSVYVTWKEYIETISVGKSDDDWHFSQEDVLVNLMWGSQVLQKIGREVRSAENAIVRAEKMAGMAWLGNSHPYASETIDEAWRTLMLAQHHDSWIVPYNRLTKNTTWAGEISKWTAATNSLAATIVTNATRSFVSGDAVVQNADNQTINTSGKMPEQLVVTVFNTVGVPRAESVGVELPDELINVPFTLLDHRNRETAYTLEDNQEGKKLVFKAEVPSFGYATYTLKAGRETSAKNNMKDENSAVQVSENECIVENDMYRVVLDLQKGGTVKSLVAKKEGNKEFATYGSGFSIGELRGYFYDDQRFFSSTEQAATVNIISATPAGVIIDITGTIASHSFTQRMSLRPGQRAINIELTVDWKQNVGIGEYRQGKNWRDNRRAFCDDRFKLNLCFPVDLHNPTLYKNAPFDVCESKLENTFFSSWDSIKHNVVLNWVDLSEKNGNYGLALFTDHTTSYSYGKDFPLSLTVQYSGIGLWGWDYKITGPTTLRYALVPHSGKWDESAIATENAKWNEPLIATLSGAGLSGAKSWIDTGKSGYELSSAGIQDDALLLRLFNAEGDSGNTMLRLNFPVSEVVEVDLKGDVLRQYPFQHKRDVAELTLSMPRFGLKTLLIKKKTIQ